MANNLTTEDVEELFETSNRQIREETTEFHRYYANLPLEEYGIEHK